MTSEILDLTAPSVANDPRFRSWWLRYSRLTMPRQAATTMYRWVTEIDIRSILPSIRVPTLVLHRSGNRHHRVEIGRYLAEHIPQAKYVELPGADSFPFHAGDSTPLLDEVEEFLTGTRASSLLDRRLATIVFTDIVGSTQLAAERGDRTWINLVRSHDEIVRDHLRAYRGREVDHTGDGFLAIFDGPHAPSPGPLAWSTLRELGVTIRVGLHTGEIELVGDAIRGLAVHIAARVMSVAEDGGILVSATVKDLVLGSGIDFADRGTHRLKGVPGGVAAHRGDFRAVTVHGQPSDPGRYLNSVSHTCETQARARVVDDRVDLRGRCSQLEQRCEHKCDAPCLRTAPNNVAGQELFIRRVEDSDVDVRQTTVGCRHGSLKPEPS